MGIVPIPGIGGATANARVAEHEVQPAIAVEPSDRMQDDSYHGGRQSAERGMEEEEPAPEGDETPPAGESSVSLNLFA